jgi:hypothetical protein
MVAACALWTGSEIPILSTLMREADGKTHVDSDQHDEGRFSRAAWLTWMREAGFDDVHRWIGETTTCSPASRIPSSRASLFSRLSSSSDLSSQRAHGLV